MKRLERYLNIFMIALVAAGLARCSHSDLWNELPDKISYFISQYFPNSELNSVTETSDSYHVRINKGAGLTFDKDGSWTVIDGYGLPLPQVLLFDQLPPKLYDYLQETEQLNEVFSMQRDKVRYTLTLLDSDLIYDIASEEISSPAGSDTPTARTQASYQAD